MMQCMLLPQIKGRTIRVDHVSNYRPPKDSEDIDDITKRLREEGCAPKMPTASSPESESEEEYLVPMKKPKKGKQSFHLYINNLAFVNSTFVLS